MVNKVFLQGRLTADPEIKSTQAGKKIVNFSLAVDRNFRDRDGNRKADFIRCEAWGGTAETVGKFFKKGSMIFVIGSMYQDTYTDNNGNRREKVWCNVAEVYFSENKKSDSDNGTYPNAEGATSGSVGAGGATYPSAANYGGDGVPYAGSTNQFEDLDDDGPLPF